MRLLLVSLAFAGCAGRALPIEDAPLGGGPDLGVAAPLDLGIPIDLARVPDLAAPRDLAPAPITFEPPRPLTALGAGSPMFAADWDGDGADDLLAVYGQTGGFAICWGDRSQPLTHCDPVAPLPSGQIREFAAADVTGDGKLDLLFTFGNSGGEQLEVQRNLGGRMLAAPVGTLITKTGLASGIASGDVNHDGRPDVVVSVYIKSWGYALFLGGPNGLAAPIEFDLGPRPTGVGPWLGDFDRDGNLDILDVGNVEPHAGWIYRGDGKGGFVAGTQFTVDGGALFRLADLAGDGNLDLLASQPSGFAAAGNVTILRGRGDGSFAAAVNVPCGPSPLFLAVADFNRDGVPDIVCGTASSTGLISDMTPIHVLRGHGDGTFAPAIGFAIGHPYLWQITSGDFDGNGAPDLVYGWGDGTNGFFQQPELLLNATVP